MITGLLLTADQGPRLGRSRLLEHLDDGAPRFIHSARSLREAVDRAVALVRPANLILTALLRQCGFEVVCCPGPQGSALAFGVRVTGGSTGWLIALADMPYIKPTTAQAVAARLRAGAIIAAPYFGNRRGYPVGFGRALGPQLGALTGNADALALIKAHRHLLTKVPCSDSGILENADISGGARIAMSTPQAATQEVAPL